MHKYGLQLRVQPQQSKKPPRPPPVGFGDDDDDDVEKKILRQAAKKKSNKDVEEQHKKALQEDPSVFDYDAVYDHMKHKIAQPRLQERDERKPRYIEALMKKAQLRQREHEVIYEKKLAKERSKEDHLYEGKDKFVTTAYKKKLAEQAKWMEEERIRQLKEEKDDVTKKSDLTDFYFNIGKNVAFGAKDAEAKKQEKQAELQKLEKLDTEALAGTSDKNSSPQGSKSNVQSSGLKEASRDEASPSPHQPPRRNLESLDEKPVVDEQVPPTSTQAVTSTEQPLGDQPKNDHHKRNDDAVAAAKERFLARKKAKLLA
ncbi:Coiled-coil domain-containing protein 55 (DUF2040) [Euphorbia peplus]|nr:Coiled-coil domain-containing protein 55 (DUF2040) [Euphorbia peplus]